MDDFKTSPQESERPTARATVRRATAALMRRPEIRALSRQLARRRERSWIVGGAPRDLILGRPVGETDVAVQGDAGRVAADMERAGFGRSVLLSSAAPRVFRLAGSREIDFADLAGSTIEEDLARRDFTVNAIAVEIPGAIWVDPFGGIGDLRARRLRIVRLENLRDDPARVLRAARFVATHELAPDVATSHACRETAGELAGVAPERLRIELMKLLEAPHVVPALTWAARVEALAPALGVSSAAARRLRPKLPLLDRPAIRRLDPATRRRIRLALVAAGLGLSPSESSRWLGSRRFSRQESGDIALLLELARGADRANSDRQRWEWVRDAAGNAEDALRLFSVLEPGRNRQARALQSRVQRARSGPSVRGSDLLKWLEIEPGPRVGALLRDLELEALRGAIRTRRQARKWLKDRTRGG